MDRHYSDSSNAKAIEQRLLQSVPTPSTKELIYIGNWFHGSSLEWLPTSQSHTVLVLSDHDESVFTSLVCRSYVRHTLMGSQSSRNYASVVFPELCMLDETLAIFDIYARMDKLRLYSTGGCSFLRYDGVEHKLTVNRSVSGQFLEQEISLGPMDVFLVTTGHLSGDVETELQEKIGTRRVGDSSTIASIMESSVSASSPRYWGIRRRGSGATIAALNQLTDRERDVIVQLLQGSTMKQISSELGISIQTTAKHRVRILEKLSVKNDVQLLLRVFPVLDNHGRLPRKF